MKQEEREPIDVERKGLASYRNFPSTSFNVVKQLPRKRQCAFYLPVLLFIFLFFFLFENITDMYIVIE